MFDLHAADFATIGLLVVLEGLLSADNALVMAILVLGLPRSHHKKALRYGLLGGFAFRIAATVLAAFLIGVAWIKLIGGSYLAYLTWTHFRRTGGAEARHEPPRTKPAFGLSAFWATVVRVELLNLAFSVDSILVAVAMSRKLPVVLAGGILGIVAMRLVVGRLLELIRRHPSLVDGAFVIIGWVALKLILEYAHDVGWVAWEIPRAVSLGVVAAIICVSYLYARRQPARDDPPQKTDSPSPLDTPR